MPASLGRMITIWLRKTQRPQSTRGLTARAQRFSKMWIQKFDGWLSTENRAVRNQTDYVCESLNPASCSPPRRRDAELRTLYKLSSARQGYVCLDRKHPPASFPLPGRAAVLIYLFYLSVLPKIGVLRIRIRGRNEGS